MKARSINRFFLALLPVCCLLSACSKIENSSSAPIAEDRNDKTLECKLNGNKWVASAITSGETQVYLMGDTGLSIYGRNNIDRSVLSIAIFDADGLTNGEYQLNTLRNSASFMAPDKMPDGYYRIDNSNAGTCTIAIDRVNKIVSGTFQFKLKSDSTTDIINVTEGRYSILYHQN